MDKCKLNYFGTAPTSKSILLTCSIFQLKKMYEHLDTYTRGLDRLIRYATKLKYHLLIYFDESIKHNDTLKKILDDNSTNKSVYFCEYRCPDYLNNDTHHRNVFGMYVRLLPIFDKTIKFKCVYISDIDYTELELLFFIKSHIKQFMDSKYKYACNYKIGYEWKYISLFNIPNTNVAVLSNLLLKEHILSPDFLFSFLKKLKDKDKLISDIQNYLIELKQEKKRKAIEFGKRVKKNVQEALNIKYSSDLFSYGLDEYFTNKYLIPELEYDNLGVFYIYDSLVTYVEKILEYDKIPHEILNNYTMNILGHHSTDLVNSFKKIINLNRSPNVSNNLILFDKVKNNYIDETIIFYNKYPHYFIGKTYKDFLCNLLIHKNDGINQSLYDIKHIDSSVAKYVENMKIYPFTELLKLKDRCVKQFDIPKCLTYVETREYLTKINSFYKYDKSVIEKTAKNDICYGDLHKKVKLLNKNEVDIIVKLGKRVIDFLDKYNILYWIDGGTLLGSLRDGKFIPWDDDMDLVIPTEYFNMIYDIIQKNKEDIQKKYNFTFTFNLEEEVIKHKILNNKIKNFFIKVYDTNHKSYFIDLMLGTLIKDRYYLPMLAFKGYNYKMTDVFPLRKIKFENKWVNCPNNPYPFINHGYLFWRHISVADHAHINKLKQNRNKWMYYINKPPFDKNKKLKEDYNILDVLNIIKVVEEDNKKVLEMVEPFMKKIKGKKLESVVTDIYEFYNKIHKLNILESPLSKLYLESSIKNYNGVIKNSKILEPVS